MPSTRNLQLTGVGLAAGLVAGLFGVGGGSVIVPLLIVGLGYGARQATGTSLAAIVIVAAVGTATHALYGNVHFGDGLLIGLPAVAGVIAGTWLQQRLDTRAIRLLFAAMLVAVAIDLVLK